MKLKKILITALMGITVTTVPFMAEAETGNVSANVIQEDQGTVVNETEAENIDLKQIKYDGEIVTYNTEIPKCLYDYETTSFGSLKMEDPPIRVVTNSDGIIRAFYLMSDEIETYDGVKVGMSVNRIKATYPNVVISSNGKMYMVMFDDEGNDIEVNETNKNMDCFYYTYMIYDDRIESIMISDSTYAKYMK